MRLIRSLGRLALSLTVLAIVRPAAWWSTRRVRRASRDMRRATYLATRAVRTLTAVGSSPIALTASGVPAMPPLPALAR